MQIVHIACSLLQCSGVTPCCATAAKAHWSRLANVVLTTVATSTMVACLMIRRGCLCGQHNNKEQHILPHRTSIKCGSLQLLCQAFSL
jgi:hypothetical protein